MAHAGAGRAAAASALRATDGARRECSGTVPKPPVGGSGAKLPSLRKGTGGRSSFNGVVCTVFGSNGSLGTSLINRLGETEAAARGTFTRVSGTCFRPARLASRPSRMSHAAPNWRQITSQKPESCPVERRNPGDWC